MEGKLLIVGTGLQLGHLTIEAKGALENAKKVLYLISDPITELYIKDLNKTAESLYGFYGEDKNRLITYNEIIDYVMKNLIEYKDLCVAFYGHPGVFTYPSHKVIEKARELGYEAKMLPGVSTEDMIFTDLGFDPGTYGLQTFEANQILQDNIEYDPRCYVIIWQIGVIGVKDYNKNPEIAETLTRFQNKLLLKYPNSHEVILYQASTHRMFESTIIKIELQELNKAKFNPISTLIITPLKK